MQSSGKADKKRSVAEIYEQEDIAQSYLDKRLKFSWQRLLHRKQVAALNAAIADSRPARVLEVAPGPARLSAEAVGIKSGIMVENSQEMVNIAKSRLKDRGLDGVWQVVKGDAFDLAQAVEPGSVDLAYTFRFIRHFREPERTQLYGEFHRALRQNGRLVFDVVGDAVFREVEARNPRKPSDEIAIHDATYTEGSFREEMLRHGFRVVTMQPVLRNFFRQSWISYKLDDVIGSLADGAVGLLEALPSGEPLEWVAVCEKV